MNASYSVISTIPNVHSLRVSVNKALSISSMSKVVLTSTFSPPLPTLSVSWAVATKACDCQQLQKQQASPLNK